VITNVGGEAASSSQELSPAAPELGAVTLLQQQLLVAVQLSSKPKLLPQVRRCACLACATVETLHVSQSARVADGCCLVVTQVAVKACQGLPRQLQASSLLALLQCAGLAAAGAEQEAWCMPAASALCCLQQLVKQVQQCAESATACTQSLLLLLQEQGRVHPSVCLLLPLLDGSSGGNHAHLAGAMQWAASASMLQCPCADGSSSSASRTQPSGSKRSGKGAAGAAAGAAAKLDASSSPSAAGDRCWWCARGASEATLQLCIWLVKQAALVGSGEQAGPWACATRVCVCVCVCVCVRARTRAWAHGASWACP
jgi:hypothetical protein